MRLTAGSGQKPRSFRTEFDGALGSSRTLPGKTHAVIRTFSRQLKSLGLCALSGILSLFCHGATLPEHVPATHINQDLPEYLTGDECLFCHRKDIGHGWPVNAHQLTMRPIHALPDILAQIIEHPELKPFASQVRFVLGYKHEMRLLQKSNEYGKLLLLSARITPETEGTQPLSVIGEAPFHWEDKTFAQQCAGCHTTAVDSRTQSFSAPGIDCYSCHGDVDLEHTNDPSLVYLSKTREDKAGLISQICAQCHIRTGRSQTSGLPYANNYVVGDDLFADFEVDLSETALQDAPPRERHILQTIKRTSQGEQTETCLSCHNIHRASGRKHRRVPKNNDCYICHHPESMTLTYDRNQTHHARCGY